MGCLLVVSDVWPMTSECISDVGAERVVSINLLGTVKPLGNEQL